MTYNVFGGTLNPAQSNPASIRCSRAAACVRSSPYRRHDSPVQCLVSFIKMRHQGPGRNLLSMIVMTCFKMFSDYFQVHEARINCTNYLLNVTEGIDDATKDALVCW